MTTGRPPVPPTAGAATVALFTVAAGPDRLVGVPGWQIACRLVSVPLVVASERSRRPVIGDTESAPGGGSTAHPVKAARAVRRAAY